VLVKLYTSSNYWKHNGDALPENYKYIQGYIQKYEEKSYSLKMALGRKPKHVAVMMFYYLLSTYFIQSRLC
jgi:hypothetical protein